MQITVADVQKISVKDGDMLVVFVDIAGQSATNAKQMMVDAAKFMKANMPNPNVQVIIVPANMYSFGVIDASATPSGTSLPVKGSIGTKSGSADPQDAYDRAMKGLS